MKLNFTLLLSAILDSILHNAGSPEPQSDQNCQVDDLVYYSGQQATLSEHHQWKPRLAQLAIPVAMAFPFPSIGLRSPNPPIKSTSCLQTLPSQARSIQEIIPLSTAQCCILNPTPPSTPLLFGRLPSAGGVKVGIRSGNSVIIHLRSIYI